MRKILLPSLFFALLVCFALAMGSLLYSDAVTAPAPDTAMAVIVYGSENNDRWQSLNQGIRQACRELEIETPVTNIASVGDAGGQADLIAREMAAGAKGLLIAAEDSEAMADVMAELPYMTPVVFVKNGTDGYPCVGADDAGMARALAARLGEMPQPVTLLWQHTRRDSLQARRDAFDAAVSEMGMEVHVLAPAPGERLTDALEGALTRNTLTGGTLLCLDTAALEKAIDILTEAGADVALYGIGSGGKVVHALSQQIISGVVYENEYAAGYIATMELAAQMSLAKAPDEAEIQYLYVDYAHMFDTEAERLLFPITQQ